MHKNFVKEELKEPPLSKVTTTTTDTAAQYGDIGCLERPVEAVLKHSSAIEMCLRAIIHNSESQALCGKRKENIHLD